MIALMLMPWDSVREPAAEAQQTSGSFDTRSVLFCRHCQRSRPPRAHHCTSSSYYFGSIDWFVRC